MPFTDTQRDFLDDKLPGDWVKNRKQGYGQVSYVEAWRMIEEANRIFGFDGWSRETVIINLLGQHQCEIGRDKKQGWNVSYMAKVKIEAGGVVREGTGVGHGIDVNPGLAHESAVKEAESDAMKRALITFGYRFGLALYDKEKVNVDYDDAPQTTPTVALATDPTIAKQDGPDYRRGLLYANTIPELLAAWKLIPPYLQTQYAELKDSRKDAILRDATTPNS